MLAFEKDDGGKLFYGCPVYKAAPVVTELLHIVPVIFDWGDTYHVCAGRTIGVTASLDTAREMAENAVRLVRRTVRAFGVTLRVTTVAGTLASTVADSLVGPLLLSPCMVDAVNRELLKEAV